MKRLVVLLAWLYSAHIVRAQALEPPPEAGEGDYTLERADSLDDAEFEVAIGATSHGGSSYRGSQRVSFRGGGARGTLRDGDDALAGGRVEARLAGGRRSGRRRGSRARCRSRGRCRRGRDSARRPRDPRR